VVLDTSTLVSAAIRSGSVPHQALVKALDTCFLCVSGETLAELEDVLYRRKFDRCLDRESRDTFLDLVHRGAYRFPPADPSARRFFNHPAAIRKTTSFWP
jgi:predicted nucleic acid-binding protein